MSAAVWAALIASVTSLVVTTVTTFAHRAASREARADEQRSAARIVLERYRGPLLTAASELGDRIDNIRHRDFHVYFRSESDRSRAAILTTMFRFAQFLGWRGALRIDVQLLRFEDEADTQLVAALIGDVVWALASDRVGSIEAMIWSDEQRGIGELMTFSRDGPLGRTVSYATFARDYDERFKPWMNRMARYCTSSEAPRSDRLRLLQWALYGLVRQLDEECIHRDRPWFTRAAAEIAEPSSDKPAFRVEAGIREHVNRIRPPA